MKGVVTLGFRSFRNLFGFGFLFLQIPIALSSSFAIAFGLSHLLPGNHFEIANL